jgi:hypothetical protein
MTCTVADEVVLLDQKAGLYFGLDPVGTRIWSLVTEGRTEAEICDRLETEFDVARDRLDADVAALLLDLSARGLIEMVRCWAD